MELIPILATIILVATISTFILAIGAYLMYKIRENRPQQAEIATPSTFQAEVFTPDMGFEQAPVYEPSYRPSAEPIFVQSQRPQPAQVRYTPAPQQYVPQRQEQPSRQAQAGRGASQPSEQKFMKYTSEGYVPAKEDSKDSGALKWR